MDENLTEAEATEAAPHPLIEGFHEWQITRCARQTKTTIQAVHEAFFAEDIELLETYDRLLSKKDGAWIKHLVKTVRKNPELGAVESLTEKQLHGYADMRRAINAVIYKNSKSSVDDSERDWEKENELYRFAVNYPEHVAAVAEVMNEKKTLDLESVRGLIAERKKAHTVLKQGVL
jgi:hypothetical protein